MVANARVPVMKVEIKRNGQWEQLISTIDNYHEYHGTEGEAWNQGGCAAVRMTSILGDSVEDKLCCTSGTCDGFAQLPCRSDMPGDCAGAKPAASSNSGGSGGDDSNKRKPAGPRQLGKDAQCGERPYGGAGQSIQRRCVAAAAAPLVRVALPAGFGVPALEVRSSQPMCPLCALTELTAALRPLFGAPFPPGGNAFDCSKVGSGQCADKAFSTAQCQKGLKCVRNDAKWWGCKKI